MQIDNPRLALFSGRRLAKYAADLGPHFDGPWPEIEGCLTALFVPRSGSTLMSRQFETLFEVGMMGEWLNASRLKEHSAPDIVASRQEPWFSFKCSSPTLARLEMLGFCEAYLPRTVFVRILRQDIVGQAVSFEKASQTGQWHADRKPPRPAVYNAAGITRHIGAIAAETELMRLYIESTGRPHRRLIYEEIATGLDAVKTAGRELGLPERATIQDGDLLRPIEKMGDEVNEAWKARYLTEMDASVGNIVEAYVSTITGSAPAPWIATDAASPRQAVKSAVKRERLLDTALARFSEETAATVRAALEMLLTLFPTGTGVVDAVEGDKLVIRFGPAKKATKAIFTLKAYQSGKVKLFLAGDLSPDDPERLLVVRNNKTYLVLRKPTDLAEEAALGLLRTAAAVAEVSWPSEGGGRIVKGPKADPKHNRRRPDVSESAG